jgi:hypothetical protein
LKDDEVRMKMRSFVFHHLVAIMITLFTLLAMCTLIVQNKAADLFSIIVIAFSVVCGSRLLISAVTGLCDVFKGQLLLTNRVETVEIPKTIALGVLPIPCNLWLFFDCSTDYYFGDIIVREGSEFDNHVVFMLSLPRIQPIRQRLYLFGNARFKEFWPKHPGSTFDPIRIAIHQKECQETHIWIDLKLSSNLIGTSRDKPKNRNGGLLVVVRSQSGQPFRNNEHA